MPTSTNPINAERNYFNPVKVLNANDSETPKRPETRLQMDINFLFIGISCKEVGIPSLHWIQMNTTQEKEHIHTALPSN